MKKVTIAIVIAFIAISSVQAAGLDKIFGNAIQNGRVNGGTGAYVVNFPKNKKVSVDKLLKYMQNNDYILTGSIGTKRVSRFGYYAPAVDRIEFITSKDIESYMANMPATTTVGKAVIYPNSRKETVDVHWSGTTKNGLINGNGTGYTKLNNGSIYIVKGYFNNGNPSGNCEVTTVTSSMNSYGNTAKQFSYNRNKSVSYSVNNLSNGYKSFYMNGKYGFINERGDVTVPCRYGQIVQGFDNTGYAIVTDPSDNNQEIKIDTRGTKLGYSDKQLRINEEKRLAKIAEEKRLAEEKRIKEAEQLEAQRRKEAEMAERQRQREIEMAQINAEKLKSVGRQIYWDANVSYDLGNGVEEEGLIVGLFNKITTMDRASYVVRYTAIVESVLGDVSVKCVITNAQIIKDASIPAWQYRKQATSLLLKEVGQTRVLQLDEFNLK